MDRCGWVVRTGYVDMFVVEELDLARACHGCMKVDPLPLLRPPRPEAQAQRDTRANKSILWTGPRQNKHSSGQDGQATRGQTNKKDRGAGRGRETRASEERGAEKTECAERKASATMAAKASTATTTERRRRHYIRRAEAQDSIDPRQLKWVGG